MGIHRRSPLIRNRKTGSMEVLSETSSSKAGSYRLFPSCSRQSPEMKQSGLGSQCAGLFSTTVLGGSSSAPNLQDYARTHRKKFSSGSLSYKDEPLEEHHVAQLLRRFSTDASLCCPLSLDGALAHHLNQCSYHLRLFRNWLISGQDPLEYFYGQPPSPSSTPCPPMPFKPSAVLLADLRFGLVLVCC
eukprot:XP_014031847.1 PREDICTED: uncharacterized protein LOC106587749 isoform X4 [Salmo salar]